MPPKSVPELRKIREILEGHRCVFFASFFLGFWTNFGLQNWSKFQEQVIGVDPQSVSETILVPRNLFEAPQARFWSPQASILESLWFFLEGYRPYVALMF